MAKVLVTDTYLTNIGNAIREKNGESTTYKPSEMAAAIQAISGGGDQPQLNAPTIKITEDTLTITANKNNGNFVTGYNVYVNPGTGYVLFGTTTTLTNDLTQYQVQPGDYSIKVTAVGENFIESDYSNELNYTNVFYTVTNTLTNCTSNNSTTSIRKGSAYSATITANSGYVLKDTDVTVTMNGENISATAYSNSVITINSVAGNIVITISATKLNGVQWQETAALSKHYIVLAQHNNEIYAAATMSRPTTAKSANGVEWEVVDDGTATSFGSYLWQFVSYGNGLFAGLNGQTYYAYTKAGVWSKNSIPYSTNYYEFNSLAANPAESIVIGTWGSNIYRFYGDDLTALQIISSSQQAPCYTAFGNNKFIVCISNGNIFYVGDSTGQTFTQKTAAITFPSISGESASNTLPHRMIYANGMFVIKGTGTQVAYSTDGENWALSGTADNTTGMFNIAYGNGSWIGVSKEGKEAFSNNGIDWEVHDINYKPSDIVFYNDKFIATNYDNNKIIYGVV